MKKLILLSTILLTACGTIFSGTTQKITFDSDVEKNIKIYANGALVCSTTPCVVNIHRSQSPLIVTAEAKGYQSSMERIETKINTVSIINLFSIYSWTTDFATDSMWKYSQDGVYINMIPENMKKAELDKFTRESQIKHFALFNYAEIKLENPEYIKALSELTKKDKKELEKIIASSNTEVELAHNLI